MKKGLFASLTLFAVCLPLQASKQPIEDQVDQALQRSKPVPASEPVPITDFLRLPRVRHVRLNPAGTHYAALLCPTQDRNDLVVQDIARGKYYRTGGGSSSGDQYDIVNFTWLNDKELYYSVAKERMYSWRTMAASFEQFQKPRIVSMHSVVTLVGQPHDQRDKLLLWTRMDALNRGEDRGVSLVDPSECQQPSRNTTLFAKVLEVYNAPSKELMLRYLCDREGRLSYALSSENGRRQFWVRNDKDQWTKSALNTALLNPVGPGDEPGEILAIPDQREGQPSRLLRVDALTGAELGTVYSDSNYSLGHAGLRRTGRDRRLAALYYHRDKPAVVWFDEELRKVHEGLCGVLPGMTVDFESFSHDESRIIVSASNDTTPTQYYLLERESGNLLPLANARPWIEPARMRPMQRLVYASRDGLALEAYLTLPAGTSPQRPAPLVVLPHGGPYVRDVFTWHPVVQFLASRGYAVLQPNYRGSMGYDWSMTQQDPEVFRRMHDDVTDAVKAVLDSGMVDKKRIAIMGGSFGGYLALCGVAFEPGLYRCAVTMAGVFDWEHVMKESKRYDSTNERYFLLKSTLGDPKKEQARFDEISPLRHVAAIRVPLLVAHGEDDRTAYVEQSKRLVRELREHKVPHEKHFQDDEGHSYASLVAKVRLYAEIEAFLEKNLR